MVRVVPLQIKEDLFPVSNKEADAKLEKELHGQRVETYSTMQQWCSDGRTPLEERDVRGLQTLPADGVGRRKWDTEKVA